MTDLKFPQAKFFDADLGGWQAVEIGDYDSSLHEGRLECPAAACHASISYVSEHWSSGNNSKTPAHFRTSAKGEPHYERCELSPTPYHAATLRMKEALEQGDYILININFAASYKPEMGHLKPRFARAAMGDVGAEFRKDWIAAHKGEYIPFSGYNLEKVARDLKSFKEAAKDVGATTDQLRLSYHQGIMPIGIFNLIDPRAATPSHPVKGLYEEDLAGYLCGKLLEKPRKKWEWSPTPALKREVELISYARRSNYGGLLTRPAGTVEIEGKEYPLQNVLKVSNTSLCEAIQAAPSVSLVATPYIERKDLEDTLDRGTGFVHLNWPVISQDQLIING